MDLDAIFGITKPVAADIPRRSAIYVWGYNQSGQTGRREKDDELRIPKQLPPQLFGCPAGLNTRWLDIACGREHTAAIASDGSLFTWGANEFGQLGDGTEERREHPKKVKQLKSEFVKSVSCGAHCSACIAEPRANDGSISTGRLWVWGQNQGSNLPRLFWGAFETNTVIKQVSCGAVHVVALSEEGLLQAWGYNEYGQLGRGVTCEGLQGARIISSYAKFLDEAPEPVKITSVSCGEYHTAAISDEGEVYTWGLGSMGQLGHSSLQYGDKELLPRRVVSLDSIFIKDVSCGGVHTCALTQEGALYAWGGGQSGQLGLGPDTGLFSCVVNDSRTFFRNIPVLVVPKSVQLVACGHSHTLICMKDGRIHGWGYNSYGQAANEKSTYAWYPSPVDWCVGEVRKLAAGGGHSAVLTDAYSLKELCEFVLADSMTLSNAAKVEDIAYRTGSDALARLCGRLREYMLASGAHGQDEEKNSYNEYGQLGRGVTCEGLQGARIISSYAKFLDEAPEPVKISSVSCGEYHTAAISDEGEVYTWRLGSMGQLGHSSLQYGDKELLPRRVVSLDSIFIKDVSCGGVHTCALTQEGALYPWGGGQSGQLGLGPDTGLFSCVVNDSRTFFRNIPVLVVPKSVQLVACGHSHTLICMKDGRIHGWGYNSYGQAANEKTTYAWYPSPVDWCVGEVRKLAAGGGHSAVLTDAYSLKELCEFVLADSMTLSNAAKVEDIAYRTGSDALARLCGRLREYMLASGAHGQDEEKNSKI